MEHSLPAPRRTSFLDLPFEIREVVYEYMMADLHRQNLVIENRIVVCAHGECTVAWMPILWWPSRSGKLKFRKPQAFELPIYNINQQVRDELLTHLVAFTGPWLSACGVDSERCLVSTSHETPCVRRLKRRHLARIQEASVSAYDMFNHSRMSGEHGPFLGGDEDVEALHRPSEQTTRSAFGTVWQTIARLPLERVVIMSHDQVTVENSIMDIRHAMTLLPGVSSVRATCWRALGSEISIKEFWEQVTSEATNAGLPKPTFHTWYSAFDIEVEVVRKAKKDGEGRR